MNTPSSHLHPDTTVGYVTLTVRDLKRALAWYTERLGFSILAQEDGTARLGADAREILRLVENPSATRPRIRQ